MLTTLYADTCGVWQGCDWHTRFGTLNVDLCRLRSQQTRLLSDATSGEEAQVWEEATGWLRQIEHDAQAAETAAGDAVQWVRELDFNRAEQRMREAVNLEAKYRTAIVWGPLATLIAELHRNALSGHTS